jgi:hypothetical protein
MAALEDLRTLAPDVFASQYIFEATPHVFGGDFPGYVRWKTEIGGRLDIDPRAICLVGSAVVGISLNPNKGLKPFDESSDVDVAVVSNRYFELAWHHLRKLRIQKLEMPAESLSALKAHRERFIFDGTIATDSILPFLPFAITWVPALSDMAGIPPTEGREINARIDRDFESLGEYQLRSVIRARAALENNA